MSVLRDREGQARDPVEAELVARAQVGDADAFGELYELHVDRVYRYVAYRVSSEAEAEDLTEQVFLKAWEAMPRYEERGLPYRAWLFRLAHNLVVDHYRLRRRDLPLSLVPDGDTPGALALPGPHADVETRLEIDELRQAVGQLGEEQRQVVLLRFVEGLSHGEVAAILGKSEGTTRVIQHRALLALARLLNLVRAPHDTEVRERGRRVARSSGAGLAARGVPRAVPGAPARA